MRYSSAVFSHLLQFVSRHDFKTGEEKGFRPQRKLRSLKTTATEPIQSEESRGIV